MYLNNRLSRLERFTLPLNSDGFPPCGTCDNGSKKQVVYRFEGDEPFPPLPTCPACGRDIAFLFNFYKAEKRPREQIVPNPGYDRPSPSVAAHDSHGDASPDNTPHL